MTPANHSRTIFGVFLLCIREPELPGLGRQHPKVQNPGLHAISGLIYWNYGKEYAAITKNNLPSSLPL